MSRPSDLAQVLRRLAPRLEKTFRRNGITPSEAAIILDDAVLEVQLRAACTPDSEARLLRAVERGCAERLRMRRRERTRQAEEAPGTGSAAGRGR